MLFAGNEGSDFLLPRVSLVSSLLLRRDELAFESGVRPPPIALPIEVHGFGEELIAVADQRLDVLQSAGVT
jgi:hypothetical protein